MGGTVKRGSSPDNVRHQKICWINCSWGARTTKKDKRSINPHVLSNALNFLLVQLGPVHNDPPWWHLGLCQGSGKCVPYLWSRMLWERSFQLIWWDLLSLVKLMLRKQIYHLLLQNQLCPMGLCSALAVKFLYVIRDNRCKLASLKEGLEMLNHSPPYHFSFIQDFINILSSHLVQHRCLSDLKVLFIYPDIKRKSRTPSTCNTVLPLSIFSFLSLLWENWFFLYPFQLMTLQIVKGLSNSSINLYSYFKTWSKW